MIKARLAVVPILSIAIFTVGCDFAKTNDVNEMIEVGREIVETRLAIPEINIDVNQNVDPLQNIQESQISPREQELGKLNEQISAIKHGKLEPLHRQMGEGRHIDKQMAELEHEFTKHYRQIDAEQRALETEFRNTHRNMEKFQRNEEREQQEKIRTLEKTRNQVHRNLDGLHRGPGEALQQLYRERDHIYEEMGNPSNNSEHDKLVRDLENIQRRIDETNHRYMDREDLLNSKIEQLVENMRSSNDKTTKDEWFARAKDAGERIHKSWNSDLENLEQRKEEIQGSLKQLESQPNKHDLLQEEAWTIEQEITKQESAIGEQIESLENELREIEDQLQTLYHGAEERRWKVEDEFNQNMETLEARRFDLEDKRQTLDQEVEIRRNQLINKHEDKMALTRDQIDEIYQNEFLPIRDRIEQLEFELVELRREERKSENQGAPVNIDVGPVTNTNVIQLLHEVLDTAKISS